MIDKERDISQSHIKETMKIPLIISQAYRHIKNPADTKKFNTVIPYFKDLEGCEIGGPTSVFLSIYKSIRHCDCVNFSSETVWTGQLHTNYVANGTILGKQLIMDGTNLNKISDKSYDFILSSNNLEHIANPLKAVEEWKRVMKGGGLLLILVPQKDFMFDHNRETTSFAHILDDFDKNILEDDLTHLDEILKYHDLSMDKPAGTYEEFKKRSLSNFENRCLHHHVYDLNTLEQIFDHVNITTIDKFSAYHNYVILGQKEQ